MKLNRVLLCLGLTLSAFSMWDTLGHSWDPAFQAPALPLGQTHTQYHAFREFTLSVGAAAVLLYVMFLTASPADAVPMDRHVRDGSLLLRGMVAAWARAWAIRAEPSGNLRASGRNDSLPNERGSGLAVLFPIANRPTWK